MCNDNVNGNVLWILTLLFHFLDPSSLCSLVRPFGPLFDISADRLGRSVQILGLLCGMFNGRRLYSIPTNRSQPIFIIYFPKLSLLEFGLLMLSWMGWRRWNRGFCNKALEGGVI